jgi:hypothetical protein
MTGLDTTLFSTAYRRIAGGLTCSMLLGLANLPAGAAEPQFTHTVIATTGAAAPGGSKITRFLSQVALSSRGQLAFDALLRGTSMTGVFRGSEAATTAIALGGPSSTAANLPGFVSAPFITSHGDVVFNFSASLDSSTTIFSSDGVDLVQLMHDGDRAPGGGILTFSGGMDVNRRGAFAFSANVSGAAATVGIFRTDRSGTVAIATDASPLPTGGTLGSSGNPALNDRGQVAFQTTINGGPVAFGLFRGDGKRLTTILAPNQTVADVTLVDFGEPTINDRGQVLCEVNAQDASGQPLAALVLADGINITAIAVDGQAAPKGGNYARGFLVFPQLNNHGQATFSSLLTGGTSDVGIFRGDGASTTTIAVQGSPAPGTAGGTFQSFSAYAMDANGRVAFIATLTPGVGDTDASNNMGIWMGTSEANLHLVVRTGDSVGGAPLVKLSLGSGDIKLVAKAIAWLGTISGNAESIVLTSIVDGRQ